jgi:flagellar M-ring protein FliF
MPSWVQDAEARWAGLGGDQRRSLVTWVVSGLLAVVLAGLFLTQTPYTPILTNLSPAAAGQVTQALGSLKIPYQLTGGGSTVEVPSSEADQARVDLAMQNLPASGQVGYQNLTGLSAAGMTSQQFTAAELGVLEQDLSSTLSSFQGVQAATVQIAVPPQSIWAAPVQGGSKASVYLDMAGGASPPASEVNGIVALVAHAVPGLSPGGVTVVDQNGTLLTGSASPSINSPAGMFQEEAALDAQGEAQVRQLLIPIVGGNNVEVAVAIQIAPQHQTTTETLPQASQVSQSSKSLQTSSGSNGTTTGTTGAGGTVTGTTGNTATPYPSAGTGSSASKSQSSSTQYAVGTLVRTTVGPPVLVTGITASVVVNQKSYPLTPGRTRVLRNLVAGALGIPARAAASDIVVSAAPFQQVTVTPPVSNLPLPLPELEAIGAGLVVLMVLAIVMSRRRKQHTAPPARGVAPELAAASAVPAMPQVPPSRSRDLVRQLGDISSQSPDEVAALLAHWLDEAE